MRFICYLIFPVIIGVFVQRLGHRTLNPKTPVQLWYALSRHKQKWHLALIVSVLLPSIILTRPFLSIKILESKAVWQFSAVLLDYKFQQIERLPVKTGLLLLAVLTLPTVCSLDLLFATHIALLLIVNTVGCLTHFLLDLVGEPLMVLNPTNPFSTKENVFSKNGLSPLLFFTHSTPCYTPRR